MRTFNYIYHLLFNFMLIACVTSCSEDNRLTEDLPVTNEKATVNAQLFLSLNWPEAGTRAGSYSLPGTSKENVCKKLTLFIMDTDYKNIETYTAEDPDGLNRTLYFNVTTTEGDKYIFVGANMTDTQINGTKNNWNSSQSLTGSIDEVTGENGFLMTGQAIATNGNKERITITTHQTTMITSRLNRVTSKVLLTCKTDNKGYIELSRPNGYIRLEDVHYVLETTNKKFFPFEKANNEDPNYSMTATLDPWKEDNFFKCSGNVENSNNIAVKTDASRLANADNPYNEGIYCLENTVNIDYEYGNDLSYPKQVATYLKIAAKFTPKYIDGDSKVWSEEEAISKLGDGTFYVCRKAPSDKKHICYSTIATGISFLGEGMKDTDFTKCEGGWQYYEAFVASPVAFTEASNLKRNHYYITNITSMTAPAYDKTIEVNTVIAAWTLQGRSQVEIETSK